MALKLNIHTDGLKGNGTPTGKSTTGQWDCGQHNEATVRK